MFVEKKVEERSENDQNNEVQNIVKSQEVIEIIIAEHSDSIKRLDTEIAQLVKAQQRAVETKEAPEITIDKKKEGEDGAQEGQRDAQCQVPTRKHILMLFDFVYLRSKTRPRPGSGTRRQGRCWPSCLPKFSTRSSSEKCVFSAINTMQSLLAKYLAI